jgi:hypothetical protein
MKRASASVVWQFFHLNRVRTWFHQKEKEKEKKTN